jgi:hypothetical protein
MKKILLFLCMAGFISTISNAQDVTFSHENSAYTPLTNPTIIAEGDWDDFEEAIIPPFPMQIMGKNINIISIEDYSVTFLSFDPVNPIFVSCVPYEQDFISTGPGSNVSYGVTGSAPNRIFTVQYKNVGFYDEEEFAETDYINYQVSFYEGKNTITYHFGKSEWTPLLNYASFISGGILIAAGEGDDDFVFHLLHGNSSSPTLHKIIDFDKFGDYFITPIPEDGKLYRFAISTPSAHVTSPAAPSGISIYPNPFVDVIHFQSSVQGSYSLYSVDGKEIMSGQMHPHHQSLNVSSIPSGVYFLTLKGEFGVETHKITK